VSETSEYIFTAKLRVPQGDCIIHILFTNYKPSL